MSQQERREAVVRQLLDAGGPSSVPPELHGDAVRRGSRMLRRRTLARRLLWVVLLAAVVAFTIWAAEAQPWVEPPSRTTPPLTRW
ncbi:MULTISPECIES: hypothetical protein [Streptomyces]|uniref:DUF3040 domain-containing protein n=1 Tax=Streptomyces lasiicapitis TaxID=1923961 RepID=A0ABQ2LI02_9ACTN|nr:MULTISPECIES: hypothetical protein [Streptomyces]QIB43879.1 hypothetical protein G3H79_13025 [Streptomyces aureoverticillatus]GGO34971.1 hypothetical protein GCM10012286_04910 [Streptomyces lasiicapitis]